jgi:hypothetical protein
MTTVYLPHFSALTGRTYGDIAALEVLATTDDMKKIDEAIYGTDILAREYALRNPLLTEEHCWYLYSMLDKMRTNPTIYLLTHKSFPPELLMELALGPENNARSLLGSTYLEGSVPDEVLVAKCLIDSPRLGSS